MWRQRVLEFLRTFERGTDVDWQAVSTLKDDVAEFKTDNPGDGLNRELFDRIVIWKLRNQRHRAADHLAQLTDQMIRDVTKTAFVLEHDDDEVLAKTRTQLLRSLPGVGLGVASAILTIYFPDDFGIIDFRTWDEIHDRQTDLPPITRTFQVGQYLTYLATIRPFAATHQFQVQEVDFALWKNWQLRRG